MGELEREGARERGCEGALEHGREGGRAAGYSRLRVIVNQSVSKESSLLNDLFTNNDFPLFSHST